MVDNPDRRNELVPRGRAPPSHPVRAKNRVMVHDPCASMSMFLTQTSGGGTMTSAEPMAAPGNGMRTRDTGSTDGAPRKAALFGVSVGLNVRLWQTLTLSLDRASCTDYSVVSLG
jgi:hypothetical protein